MAFDAFVSRINLQPTSEKAVGIRPYFADLRQPCKVLGRWRSPRPLDRPRFSSRAIPQGNKISAMPLSSPQNNDWRVDRRGKIRPVLKLQPLAFQLRPDSILMHKGPPQRSGGSLPQCCPPGPNLCGPKAPVYLPSTPCQRTPLHGGTSRANLAKPPANPILIATNGPKPRRC